MALGCFVFKNNDGKYIKPQKSIKDNVSFTSNKSDAYKIVRLSQAHEFVKVMYREKKIILHKEWVDA